MKIYERPFICHFIQEYKTTQKQIKTINYFVIVKNKLFLLWSKSLHS